MYNKKYVNINGKTKIKARVVMEAFLGRPLTSDETVHHINHDAGDNHIENLMLFGSKSEHQKYHLHENREAIA